MANLAGIVPTQLQMEKNARTVKELCAYRSGQAIGLHIGFFGITEPVHNPYAMQGGEENQMLASAWSRGFQDGSKEGRMYLDGVRS